MRGRLRNLRQLLRRDRITSAAAAVVAVYLLLAAAAPLLAPYDPYAMDAAATLSPPTASHWLGTDQFGRDLLSRVMHGARISLRVSVAAVAISLTAGSLLGLMAGYFGGRIDAVISRVVDGLLSFPDILLALAIMAVLGASLTNVTLAIGVVYTPIFARVARAAALQVRGTAYVEAARALGFGHGRILLRHVLPNAAAPLVVQTTLSLAFAMLAEAALSFLGLGVEPDAPSWGVMLNEGKDWMELAWWTAVFPGLALSLAVFSLNALGDGLGGDPARRRTG